MRRVLRRKNTQCSDDPFQANCQTDEKMLWSTPFVDLLTYTATSPELMRSGTFESGAAGWYSWPSQVSMTLVSASCRTSKCLQISQVAGMGGNTGLATDGVGHAVVQNQMYLLNF